MNDAAAVDLETQQKLKRSNPVKPARVNELQTETSTDQMQADRNQAPGQSTPVKANVKGQKVTAVKNQIETELMDAIKQLRDEVAELKKNVHQSPRPPRQFQPRTRRACRGCQERGDEEQCDHCFKCGLTGHLSRGCRAQGNPKGKSSTVDVSGQSIRGTPPTVQEQLSGSQDTQAILRESIHQLEERLLAEGGGPGGRVAGSVYVSHISPRHHSQLLRLIGKKCMVNCYLDGVKTQALWDTGSQVCLISEVCKKTEMFVRMIKTSDPECSDGVVRMGRQKEVIQAGQVRSVKCSVRTGPLLSSQEALFVPDEHAPWSEGARMMESMITLGKGTYSRLTLPVINDTGHDITLSPRTVLGQVQLVKAVYPAEAKPVVAPSASPVVPPEVNREESAPAKNELEDKDRYDPPIAVTHLPLAHQQKVKQLLREECQAFAKGDEDGLSIYQEEGEPLLCPLTIAAAIAEVSSDPQIDTFTQISPKDLRAAQDEDPLLQRVKRCVAKQQWPRIKEAHRREPNCCVMPMVFSGGRHPLEHN
ncbi:hypothetical protein N1851_004927 [Merluccius polli]|uniref:CCHC-type domain-containing protein n=1 Tax=Merluccius polli TaxID=89951 RepID=A0AA47N6L7_MERPO|nr:hypothetical protein N1851_004927 [Merluccius polli]